MEKLLACIMQCSTFVKSEKIMKANLNNKVRDV